MSHGKRPMANIPRELRKQIRALVSKKSDEVIDLVVNLTGKYVEKEKRRKLKRDAVIEVNTQIEDAYKSAIGIVEGINKIHPRKSSIENDST